MFCFAQTGPGGVGATDGTSNLIVWLKADSGPNITNTAINGIKVNTWTDHAGYNVIGLPNDTDHRPTLKFNEINEIYPSFSLDGKDDFSQLSIIESDIDIDSQDNQIIDPFSTKNNFTILFVARADVIHDTDPMTASEDGNLNGLDYQKYVLAPTHRNGNDAGFGVSLGTNGIAIYEFGSNYFPALNVVNNSPDYNIENQFHIYMIEVIEKKSVISMDGQIIGEGLVSSVDNLFIPNEIGGGITNALAFVDNYFEGDLAELIMFSNNINTTEEIVIQNYLSAKYNIELAANDRYKMDDVANGNFDHDVAGIGRTNFNDVLLTSKGPGIVCISNATDLDDDEFLFWGKNSANINALALEVPLGAASMLASKWAVTEEGDVGNQDVCLSFNMFAGANPKDFRLVIDTNGDGSFLDEDIPENYPVGFVDINTATSEITFKNQNLSSGSMFTFASKNPLEALPVALTSFRANTVANKEIQLNWTTESETDNQFFIIERSVDLRNYELIGQAAGNGTTELTNYYQLLDKQPIRGDNYYRLKQVDSDGTYSYSNIIKATIEVRNEDIFLYPNPTLNELSIDLPNAAIGKVSIEIFNVNGKLVFIENLEQNNVSKININPTLAPGIYFLRLRTKNYIHSKSFVVANEN